MGANDEINWKNYCSKLGTYFFSKSQGDAKVPLPPPVSALARGYALKTMITLNNVDILTI